MGGGEIDTDVDGAVQKANKFLSDALQLGLPYSEKFTQQAIDAQKQMQKQQQQESEAGFQRSQGLNAPYRLAGYQALDSYMDTLTLARPEMGSFKLATALENSANRDAAINRLNSVVDDVRKYQNIGGIGEGSGGDYSRGVYAENMLNLAERMMRDNVYAAGGKLQSLSGAQGNYLPAMSQNYFDADNSLGYRDQYPSAQAITEQTRKDLQSALADFKQSTQYYTPEQGSIAASFNKGLLGTPVWKDV